MKTTAQRGTFAVRLRALAVELVAGWRRQRAARATYGALRELDDRVLHDLGIERSELTSVAAEVAGQAARTRVQALCDLHALHG